MRSRGPLHRAARAVARRALRRAAKRWSKPAPPLPLSAWRLERDGEGHLTLDGARLDDVASRHGTPLHVADAVRLRENAARFVACPAAGRACEIYYSYKTNPVPGVLKLLHQGGCGAETSSPYELWLARTLGVPGPRTVYNCTVKPLESLRAALAHDVSVVNINSRFELPTLAQVARSMNKRMRVGVRVTVPHAIAAQFGERIDDGSALQTFAEALERPELDVIGLHAHLSGELASRNDLRAYLGAVLRFTNQLRARLGLDLQLLDLGGNLAVPTVTPESKVHARVQMALAREAPARPPDAVLTIDDYVSLTVAQIEAHYRKTARPVPRIALEPGRAMTSNAQSLVLTVLQVRNPDDSGVSTAVLDGGINVADPLRAERHEVVPVRVRPGAELRRYRLAGPTCAMGDLLYPHVVLPHLEPGDRVAVMDAGAYFIPFSTTFSFPRPGVVMLEHGDETVLRRPETFEDLVALDRLDLEDDADAGMGSRRAAG